jgi:hypothetical protein
MDIKETANPTPQDDLLSYSSAIKHPKLVSMNKRRSLNHHLDQNAELNVEKQTFELNRFTNKGNSWDDPNRYIGSKMWINYMKDNCKRDSDAASRLMTKKQKMAFMKNQDYRNFVNNSKQDRQAALETRRVERMALQKDSEQAVIEEFDPNHNPVNTRTINSYKQLDRKHEVANSLTRSSMHRNVLFNRGNTWNDHSSLASPELRNLYTKKIITLQEHAIHKISTGIHDSIDQQFKNLYDKKTLIKDQYFVARNKRDIYHSYCDKFDQLKNERPDLGSVKSSEGLRIFFDDGSKDLSGIDGELYVGDSVRKGCRGDYTEKPYSFVGREGVVSALPSRIVSAFVGKPGLQAEGQNLVSQGTAGTVRFEKDAEGGMIWDGREEESRMTVQQRYAYAKESRMNSEPVEGS